MSLEDLESEVKQNPLETLSRLQLWQLAAVPWGNIGLHYSTHHTAPLDTDALFTKIVERRMGGYCMENNAFFATVLRSLGYDLYTTGARVSNSLTEGHKEPEGYTGWTHMVNIVTIHGQKNMVDVGFGSFGPILPMRLRDGETVPNIPTSQMRLLYKPIAPCTDSSQKLWVFEVRTSPESSWSPQYCFSELEFLPQDFIIMNFSTSQSRRSWFTQRLVLTRIVLDEEGKKPIGNLTLSTNELKGRLHGQSETLMICKTEEERVQALEKYFYAKLRPEEIRGIQGLQSEIK